MPAAARSLAIVIYRILSASNGILEHANVRLWMSRLVVVVRLGHTQLAQDLTFRCPPPNRLSLRQYVGNIRPGIPHFHAVRMPAQYRVRLE